MRLRRRRNRQGASARCRIRGPPEWLVDESRPTPCRRARLVDALALESAYKFSVAIDTAATQIGWVQPPRWIDDDRHAVINDGGRCRSAPQQTEKAESELGQVVLTKPPMCRVITALSRGT